jgi:hypothetical protein
MRAEKKIKMPLINLFSFGRAERLSGHLFASEGELTKVQIVIPGSPVPQDAVNDRRRFEAEECDD